MGFGGISIWQLLIILAIIVLLFGTKRLRSFGADLGAGLRGFRKAVHDSEDEQKNGPKDDKKSIDAQGETIEGSASRERSSSD